MRPSARITIILIILDFVFYVGYIHFSEGPPIARTLTTRKIFPLQYRSPFLR